MSGPWEPSAGRAEKATHCPSALYAGGVPTMTTPSTMATAGAADGAGVAGRIVGSGVAAPGSVEGVAGSGEAGRSDGEGEPTGGEVGSPDAAGD